MRRFVMKSRFATITTSVAGSFQTSIAVLLCIVLLGLALTSALDRPRTVPITVGVPAALDQYERHPERAAPNLGTGAALDQYERHPAPFAATALDQHERHSATSFASHDT